jgi:ribosomal protein L17
MKQQISKINVSDKEAKETYEKMVKIAKKSDSTQKIPTFSQVKENIKLQIKKDQVVNNLMKNAKIKIY